MMKIEKLRVKVGSDGLIHLKMPAETANMELEIELAWETLEIEQVDANGWPLGYFDRTYGSFADDPLEEIKPMLPEERDPIE